jgi:hypothetical protein
VRRTIFVHTLTVDEPVFTTIRILNGWSVFTVKLAVNVPFFITISILNSWSIFFIPNYIGVPYGSTTLSLTGQVAHQRCYVSRFWFDPLQRCPHCDKRESGDILYCVCQAGFLITSRKTAFSNAGSQASRCRSPPEEDRPLSSGLGS